MKIWILNICFLIITTSLYGQCPPEGDIIISSQQKLDEFAQTYPNCEILKGNLILRTGLTSFDTGGTTVNNITNLSSINYLKGINGNLEISTNASEIIGFTNLEFISGDLRIVNGSNLNIINGFENLKSAKTIDITYNTNLTQIFGFTNLEILNDELTIAYSDQLKIINGFEKLKSIKIDFNIGDNPLLESIPTFNELAFVGDDFFINNNPKLKKIEGFSKLSIVGGEFLIENNSIEFINGFQELIEVGKLSFDDDFFIVNDNQKLKSVNGFYKLTFVNADVKVTNNLQLSNCSWLCNLIKNGTIEGDLKIQNNLGDCLNSSILLDICDVDFDNDGIPNSIDVDDDNDGILDVLEGNGLVDTDGDGFPDSKDLDSDKDYCFDVIEAGFFDEDNDGILGVSPVLVNFQGRVMNTLSGYTTPDDKNNNGVFDFLEKSTLDPGKNTVIEICDNLESVNLLEKLEGTPDDGGIWEPLLASNSNIFDPKKDRAGIYTYIHKNELCGERTAQIEIKILLSANAGENTEVFVCKTEKIDLFSKLKGNPELGGSWSPETVEGKGIFNPAIDKFGVYTYTVTGEQCGSSSAKINVINSKFPNAGLGTTITICEFSPPINLFSYLTNNPDTNGTWYPQLDNGYFDPSVNQSAVYTYTVDNGDCGISTSQVAVVVVKDNELNNVFVQVNDFSAINNSIVIYAPKNREYEYSLDGLHYQSNNSFNNLNGGYQTVYVKGVDGCEYYQEEVFIRTYPTFFTPNNDGDNDFWGITNFPASNYDIYIYDRFGNYITKLNKHQLWDGTKNGSKVNAKDLWFKLITNTGEILFGNFSLIAN